MMKLDENEAHNMLSALSDFIQELNKAHAVGSPQVTVEVVIDALKNGGILSQSEANSIESQIEL